MSNEGLEKPIVSVIITTYERIEYLKRAIKSVLSQTLSNFELIVVDDCSTDNTEQVVRSFDDKRIKYVKHETNLGVHIARSNGIKKSQGEFIGFLDDDDEYLPEKLEKQVELFRKLPDNYGLVYSGYYVSNGTNIIARSHPSHKGEVRDILLKFNFVGTLTTLIRSSCFKKIGYFEFMPSIEDWDMWMRIAKHYAFDYVPEPLSIYYFHEAQVSGNVDRLILGRDIMLKKYKDIWLKTPTVFINRLNDLGRLYCFSKYQFQAKRYFIESLRIKIIQKPAVLNLLLGKYFSRKFPKLFTPYNTSDNILRVFLTYLKKKFMKLLS